MTCDVITVSDGVRFETCKTLRSSLAHLAQSTKSGAAAPLVAPASLLGHAVVAPLMRAMAPPEGMSVLHESQVFRRTGAYQLDTPVTIKIVQKASTSGVQFDFSLSDACGAVGEMQTRLRFVSSETVSTFKGSAFPTHLDTAETQWRTSRAFNSQQIADYVRLMHDENPIHTDVQAAKRAGFSNVVVPGMQIAGVAEYVLSDIWPLAAISEMKVRFMAPVFLGETVRFAVTPRKFDDQSRVVVARCIVVTETGLIAAIADTALDYA